jgi:hypothetical protein
MAHGQSPDIFVFASSVLVRRSDLGEMLFGDLLDETFARGYSADPPCKLGHEGIAMVADHLLHGAVRVLEAPTVGAFVEFVLECLRDCELCAEVLYTPAFSVDQLLQRRHRMNPPTRRYQRPLTL